MSKKTAPQRERKSPYETIRRLQQTIDDHGLGWRRTTIEKNRLIFRVEEVANELRRRKKILLAKISAFEAEVPELDAMIEMLDLQGEKSSLATVTDNGFDLIARTPARG